MNRVDPSSGFQLEIVPLDLERLPASEFLRFAFLFR